MIRLIERENWVPVGVDELESAAMRVVLSNSNIAVIAGPGAGKTELLAQRACYLLQTGVCQNPKRILAISFKKDAASNLKERVQRRCGDLSGRFDSLTFDAFAKGLVDRFGGALLGDYKPSSEYLILKNITEKQAEHYLSGLEVPKHFGKQAADVPGILGDQFLKNYFYGLPITKLIEQKSSLEWAAWEMWRQYLNKSPSELTFPMIGRLAQCILQTNPLIREALRTTYSHVFLDEFQDTTNVQFELVREAFHNSQCIVTAVGDNKQRIMGWAMALDNAFLEFRAHFLANTEYLTMNFRSDAGLVKIQHHLIRALDSDSILPTAHDKSSTVDPSACMVTLLPSEKAEAEYLASSIKKRILNDGVPPREICVLVKQLPEIYTTLLIDELKRSGILARNEAVFQDLLSEPVTKIILAFFELLIESEQLKTWNESLNILCELRGAGREDVEIRRLEAELRLFRRTNLEILHGSASYESLETVINNILEALDITKIKLALPQYRQGQYLRETTALLCDKLFEAYLECGSWSVAVQRLYGFDSVPIMTVHKSKGLEYDTVYFVGLEDSAFWKFRTQSLEDRCTFFVAFSRAKKRVEFTFSAQRTLKYGLRQQSRDAIGELYELLKSAGVTVNQIY